jgi:hypothetical protein
LSETCSILPHGQNQFFSVFFLAMPQTRAGLKRKAEADATPDGEDCAICLAPMDAASRVKLACGHFFHGQCAARWLQLDRRCPNCRDKPSGLIDEHDTGDVLGEAESILAQDIVSERLEKVKTWKLRAVLRDYDVHGFVRGDLVDQSFYEVPVDRATKRELVGLLSEQLLNETDDDDSGDEV